MVRRGVLGRAAVLAAFALCAGGAVGVGCVDPREPFKPGPVLCSGAPCGPTVGSGSGSGSSGGTDAGTTEDGGDSGLVVTGSVVVTNSAMFDSFSVYTGETTVFAPAAGGGEVSAPCGGVAGSTFTLKNAAGGQSWLFVRDDTQGGTGIFSTYSNQTVSNAPLPVPVVDMLTLSTIATPVGTFVDMTKAQVILRVRRKGAPIEGVSLKDPGDGIVVYDDGQGSYSAGVTATGTGGVILLFNVTPQGAEGTVTVTLTEGASDHPSQLIPALAGGATLAKIDLQ